MQAPATTNGPPGVAGRPVPPPRPGYPSPHFPLYFCVFATCLAFFMKTAVHQIPEGCVGAYWRGGKLLKRITPPGIHTRMPLLDTYEAIQVTMQTDKVTDIPCGTKGGVNITFDKIEVVNRLKRELVYDTIREYGVHYDATWIYDKIHHEINQFCSSHTLQEVYIDKFDQVDEKIKEALQADCNRYAPGIEIIAVRVTKPTIPETIMANYVAMEVERTKAMVAVERQKVIEREVEAERTKAIAQAQKAAETSRIWMDQLLAEKEAARKQADIENAMYVAKQKALADAEHYRVEREAAAYRAKLTPEYLELAFINAVANNTKIFFGERLPSLFLDQRLLFGPKGAGLGLDAPAAAGGGGGSGSSGGSGAATGAEAGGGGRGGGRGGRGGGRRWADAGLSAGEDDMLGTHEED